MALTDEGARHPVMRLDAAGVDLRRKWAALPALAGAAGPAAPRPGASVLAFTTGPAGGLSPLVTVQRFGAGRALVFGGEASWHWKMMMPASENAYDVFWRQSLRWLTGEVPDPVAIAVPAVVPPGTTVPVDVAVRDASFAPVARPAVTASLRGVDGVRDLPAAAAEPGHVAATWQADTPGVFELAADARDGDRPLGSASRFVLVGGVDPEFTDPRMNDETLRRLAGGTGGDVRAGARGVAHRCPAARGARGVRPAGRCATSGTTRGRCCSSRRCCRPSGRSGASGGCDDPCGRGRVVPGGALPRGRPGRRPGRGPTGVDRLRRHRWRRLREDVGRVARRRWSGP